MGHQRKTTRAQRAAGLAMLRRGASVEEVARKFGVTTRAVNYWQQGGNTNRPRRDADVPQLESVEVLVQAQLRQVNETRKAADRTLAAQRAAVSEGDMLGAQRAASAFNLLTDQISRLEQDAIGLAENFRRIEQERAAYYARAIEVAVDGVIPVPACREPVRRALGGWMRTGEGGEPQVAAADASMVRQAVLDWARGELPPPEPPDPGLDERRVRERVAERVDAARLEWEGELAFRLQEQEADLRRRGITDRPLSMVRVMIDEPVPEPEAPGPTAVAGFLPIEDEDGYGQAESENGRRPGEPYTTDRVPIEERQPRARQAGDLIAEQTYGYATDYG